jgi:hypothetical protein
MKPIDDRQPNFHMSSMPRIPGGVDNIGVDEFSQGLRKHRTTDIGFIAIPKYEVMKEPAFKEIYQGLGESVTGTYKEIFSCGLPAYFSRVSLTDHSSGTIECQR